MITKITLENFKGIGEETSIHLRPLTLLFGGNSSGKSTILHALAYAREILERHNCDADTTLMGGESLDLGGFLEIVHKHDPSEKVRLKFHLDLENYSLTDLYPVDEYLYERDGRQDDLSTIGDDIKSAAIELLIGKPDGEPDKGPVVLEYEIEIDGQHFATLLYRKAEKGGILEKHTNRPSVGVINEINFLHPLLKWPSWEQCMQGFSIIDEIYPCLRTSIRQVYFDDPCEIGVESIEELQKEQDSHEGFLHLYAPLSDFILESLRCLQHEADGKVFYHWVGIHKKRGCLADQAIIFPPKEGWTQETADAAKRDFIETGALDDDFFYNYFLLPEQSDALPKFQSSFGLVLLEELDAKEEPGAEEKRFSRQLLQRLICGPGQILQEILSQTLYIGPVRKTPPRNYSVPHHLDLTRWADGIGAWDFLYATDEYLVDEVSDWLENPEKLNTGYRLLVDHFKPISRELQTRLLYSDPDDLSDQSGLQEQLDKLSTGRSITLWDIGKDTKLHPHSVGVGLSQIIPVITAIRTESMAGCLVEQPELHLHPEQQAAVGDLLIQAVRGREKRKLLIIAETHSVYLILRVLRRIRENFQHSNDNIEQFSANDLMILYADSTRGTTGFDAMPISESGKMLRSWPDSFFDQDLYEKLEGTLGYSDSFQESDKKIKDLLDSLSEKFENQATEDGA